MTGAHIALLLLLLCTSLAAAGPPYLLRGDKRREGSRYSAAMQDVPDRDYKPALFGGAEQLIGCEVIKAAPALANVPLTNGAELRGKIALVQLSQGP